MVWTKVRLWGCGTSYTDLHLAKFADQRSRVHGRSVHYCHRRARDITRISTSWYATVPISWAVHFHHWCVNLVFLISSLDNRRNYFKDRLHHRRSHGHQGTLQVSVDRFTCQLNFASMVILEQLSFFKVVGHVIGKAGYDCRLLDAYFARHLYRLLLGEQVYCKDVEWVDPEYFNSLWILENVPVPLV